MGSTIDLKLLGAVVTGEIRGKDVDTAKPVADILNRFNEQQDCQIVLSFVNEELEKAVLPLLETFNTVDAGSLP